MRKTTSATQSHLNGFHTNPCKFRNFQIVMKYFLSITGLKSPFNS